MFESQKRITMSAQKPIPRKSENQLYTLISQVSQRHNVTVEIAEEV